MILGIDPGKNGGLCFIDKQGNKFLYKIPLISNEFDGKEFRSLLEIKYPDVVIIEDVHSIFGVSSNANFEFGRIVGQIQGIVQAMNFKYVLVQPKAWQKECWQGVKPVEINTGKKTKTGEPKYKIDTKATSLIAAKRLAPNESILATERSSKPHDGLVDAFLIAEYGRRKNL